jgi:hypothetical protein
LVSFAGLYRDARSTEHEKTKQKIQQLKVEVGWGKGIVVDS